MRKVINAKIKEKNTNENFNLKKEEYLRDFNRSIYSIKNLVKLLYSEDIPKYIELSKYISIIIKSIEDKLIGNEKESNEKETTSKIVCPLCETNLQEYNTKYYGLPMKYFYCLNCDKTFYKFDL